MRFDVTSKNENPYHVAYGDGEMGFYTVRQGDRGPIYDVVFRARVSEPMVQEVNAAEIAQSLIDAYETGIAHGTIRCKRFLRKEFQEWLNGLHILEALSMNQMKE